MGQVTDAVVKDMRVTTKLSHSSGADASMGRKSIANVPEVSRTSGDPSYMRARQNKA